MTTPTIFSDVAADAGASQKFVLNGSDYTIKAVLTVDASTGTGVNGGIFRVRNGMRLVSLQIKSDDLDTGTDVTIDVGYLYDTPTASLVEDDDAIFAALDIAQDAGSRVWPYADDAAAGNEGILFGGEGYLTITTGGGSTTTAGDVHVTATFCYGE